MAAGKQRKCGKVRGKNSPSEGTSPTDVPPPNGSYLLTKYLALNTRNWCVQYINGPFIGVYRISMVLSPSDWSNFSFVGHF